MTKQILTLVESCHECPYSSIVGTDEGNNGSSLTVIFCGDRKKAMISVKMGTIDSGCLLDNYIGTQIQENCV